VLATRCACGFEELADEQLIDHLLSVFEPEGAIGTDGDINLELTSLACSCGLSFPSVEQFDAHFLARFTPASSVGRDGQRHQPVPNAPR
jgi:hypothetical protein